MSDNCRLCVYRGHIEECVKDECDGHNDWYAEQMREAKEKAEAERNHWKSIADKLDNYNDKVDTENSILEEKLEKAKAELAECKQRLIDAREVITRLTTVDQHYLEAKRATETNLANLRDLYNELLYAVARKHPKESRHATALRYIRQAEQVDNIIGKEHKP